MAQNTLFIEKNNNMCMKNWFSKENTGKTELEAIIENEEVIPDEQQEFVTNDAEEFAQLEKETAEAEALAAVKRNLIVIIDNGHASSTAGKRSPKFEDGSRFFEYEFNRDVAARLAKMLDDDGIQYELITPEKDYDVPLSTRAARANAICAKYGVTNCLFISIHSNAYGDGVSWTTPSGWEVYTCVGKTKSDEVATMFWEEANKLFPLINRRVRNGKGQPEGNDGPDYEANFTVLVKTNCPAILTENFFYTNKEECEWLKTNEARNAIALLHLNGIKRWIRSKA